MGTAVTLTIDDTGAHNAVLSYTNLDGSPTKGVAVSYQSSDPSVAAVDPVSGALTLVAVGTCTITGSGVRGSFSHTDAALLTVAPAAEAGDFAVSLAIV